MAGAVLYLLAAYAITLPSGLIEGQAGPAGDLLAATTGLDNVAPETGTDHVFLDRGQAA